MTSESKKHPGRATYQVKCLYERIFNVKVPYKQLPRGRVRTEIPVNVMLSRIEKQIKLPARGRQEELPVGRETFEEIGTRIGQLVQKKNAAYGDSFAKSCKILEALYPDGVKPSQYRDMLGMVRVVDKMFRIATDKDALGESPWDDITGYGILGVKNSAPV